jgi:acetylornithine deacetylase/succinyl-diaminopimelate desuccinylase-like protein
LIRSLLRTTCVATLLRAGSRVNTLAAEAVATVNCRIMPDESVATVGSMLERVVADAQIEIRALDAAGAGAPSPISGEGVDAAREVAQAMWPGLPVLPVLDAGASDSRFLRQLGIAAYGLSPLPGFESDDYHVHGEDERVPVASLRTGVEFLHRWVLTLAHARAAVSPAPPRT